MKRIFLYLTVILCAVLTVTFSRKSAINTTSNTATMERTSSEASNNKVINKPLVDNANDPIIPALQENSPSAAKAQKAPGLVEVNKSPFKANFIKRVISEQWLDTPEKAGRRRVRVVEADFKYPHVRLEEQVWSDQQAGNKTVKLIRASIADHVMVGIKPGVDVEQAKKALEVRGYNVRAVEAGSYLLAELPEFITADAQKQSITDLEALNEFINFAEPDYIVYPSVLPNDPAIGAQKMWSFDNPGTIAGSLADADIDAPEAWDTRSGAPGVVVAVADTGIRYTHEDLIDNMWAHPTTGKHGYDAYDSDDDPMDTDGHGTHCAGTIGAKGNNGKGVSGVAWDTQIMALRFLGPNGGTTSDAVRVVNYARANGAHIISSSWGGGGFSKSLYTAIEACYTENIIFVAASGNDSSNTDATPHYPSSYVLPNIVSVASSDSQDQLSFFSNYGRTNVDIAAPGGDIWSCGSNSDSDYKYLSGTSMATPHVSGALALTIAQYPSETAEESIARVYNSVDFLPSLETKVSTGGRLNLNTLLLSSTADIHLDDFDNARPFYGCRGYWCGFNTKGTRQAGEDNFSPDTGNRSLWFKWVAPANGLVTFKGKAPSGQLSIVAFEGDEKFTMRRLGDNFSERPVIESSITFYAKEGQEYRFVADSKHSQGQLIIADLIHRVENDFVANASSISSNSSFSEEGTNCGTTAENFELISPHAGVGRGKSAWWKWTPDFNGEFVITTDGTDSDTVLAVYKGTVNSLQEVASNDDIAPLNWASKVKFEAEAGITYYIAVDGYRSTGEGSFTLSGFKSDDLIIYSSPADVVARIGEKLIFPVVALGEGELSYQWKKDGLLLPWSQSKSTLVLQYAVSTSYGTYTCEVSNGENSATAQWVLKAPEEAPYFDRNISDQVVFESGTLRLSPILGGTIPMTFQWYKDGVLLAGQTSRDLLISNVAATDSGEYQLVVSNAFGSKNSQRSRITVQGEGALNWVLKSETPNILPIAGLSHNGKLHMLSASGVIASGENIADLKNTPISGLNQAQGLETHGNLLVAYGYEGAYNPVTHLGRIYTSTDAVTWQRVSSNLDSTDKIQDFESNGSIAVACINGELRYSSDLVTWTPSLGISRTGYLGVEYSGGKFLAMITPANGDPEKYQWAISTDGINWVEKSDTTPRYAAKGSDLVSANGLFFIFGGNFLSVSADGETWQHDVLQLTDLSKLGIVYKNGFYYSNKGYISTDGYNWTMPPLDNWVLNRAGIILHNGGFVVFDNTYQLLKEFDEYIDAPQSVYDADADSDITQPQEQVSLTGDGLNSSNVSYFDKVTGVEVTAIRARHDSGNFWVMNSSSIWRGDSPRSLSELTIPPVTSPWTIHNFCVRGNVVIVTDKAGQTWRSADGAQTWALVAGLSNAPTEMKFIESATGFVGIGGGVARYSADGLNWVEQNIAIAGRRGSSHIREIGILGNRVTALDYYGYLHLSDDGGATWTHHDLGSEQWYSMAYWDGKLYLLNLSGELLVSSNHSSFVSDSIFSGFGTGISLDVYDGALVAFINSSRGSFTFQAGRRSDSGVSMLLSGLEDGELYESGQRILVNWDVTIDRGEITKVDVLLDGVVIQSTSALIDQFSFDAPAGGRHLLDLVVYTTAGGIYTQQREFYSRGEPLTLLTSSYQEQIVGSTTFENTLYVVLKDGRVFRSGDGQSWDLVMNTVSTPSQLISNSRALVLACERSVHVTQDGANWSNLSRETFDTSFLQNDALENVTVNDPLVLPFGLGGTNVYSADGVSWYQSKVASIYSNRVATYSNGRWIGNAKSSSLYHVLIPNGGALDVNAIIGERPSSIVGGKSGFIAKVSTGYLFSQDGVEWNPVSGLASGLGEVSEAAGHFFVLNPSNGKYWTSEDSLSWREVTRKPSLIHEGVWYTSKAHSSDGVDWIEDFTSSIDYTLVGFIGNMRVLSRLESSNTILAFAHENTGIVEVPSTVFDREDHLSDIGMSNPEVFLDESGDQHIFANGKYVTRSSTGEWGEVAATQIGNPSDYGGGKFYNYGSLDVYISSDGLTRTIKPLTVSTTDDGYISAVRWHDGAIYAQTSRNLHRSTDEGDSWETLYSSSTNGLGNIVDFAFHQGEILITAGFNNARPYKYDSSAGSWSEVTSSPTLRSGRLKSVAGRVYFIRDNKVYSSTDLLNWTTQTINKPASAPSTSSLFFRDIFVIQEQLVLSYAVSGEYYTYISDQSGRMQLAYELVRMRDSRNISGKIGETNAYRLIFNTWQHQGAADIACTKVSVPSQPESILTPFEVQVELSNYQDSNFSTSTDMKVRLWALPQGVNNYQDRIKLAEVEFPTAPIGAGGSVTVSRQVVLPKDTPPGDLRVFAELVSLNESSQQAVFDAVSQNNYALSDETISIAAYTLDLLASGSGLIRQNVNGNVFAQGAIVSLNASAGKGATFAGWGGDALGTRSQITILMDGNKSVLANFSSRASLQVHIKGAGEVSGVADLGSYAVGGIASLTAVPTSNWTFSHWEGAATGTNSTANVTMNESKSITAVFKLPLASWKALHFTAAEMSNPLIGGDDADIDGDGLKNWQEYLHMSNPRENDSKGVTKVSLEGGYLYILFTRNTGAEGSMSLNCRASRDLSDWNAPDLQERILNTSEGVETVEARIPSNEDNEGFLQIQYTR